MADFFDKMAAGLRSTVEYVKEMSSDVVEIGKLKAKRFQLERRREEAFSALGKLMYDMFQDDALDSDALRAKCAEIAQLDAEIAELAEREAQERARQKKDDAPEDAVPVDETPDETPKDE